MIVGKIGDHLSVNSVINKVLNVIRGTDLTTIELGEHTLDDGMIMIVAEYETLTEKSAEQHKKFVDLQYIVSGEEIIGVGFDDSGNEVIDEYNDVKDRVKYGEIVNETELKMVPGMYAVFFPMDIHRPGCVLGKKVKVRKVVIKIPVDAFLNS